MSESITSQESKIIYIVKVFAIICSITAHMQYNGTIGRLLTLTGTIGVPAFLFISGMFYEIKPRKWKVFLKGIFIPWVIGGALNWVVCYICKYNSLNLVDFLIGRGSYLWYFTVALLILFIWNYVPQKLLLILFGISILRIIAYYLDMIPQINKNMYLSVLFWNFWFALGYFARKYTKGRVLSIFIKYRVIFLCLWAIIGSLYLRQEEISYFSVMAIPFEIVSIGALFALASYVRKNSTLIELVGKNTLPIYIYHILIAGFVSGKLLESIWMIQVISPVIVLLITFGSIYFAVIISEKIKCDGFIKRIFGWKC